MLTNGGGSKVIRTNINYMMRMAKSFADGKSNGILFKLDFGYELEKTV